jgi:hypothetical protein
MEGLGRLYDIAPAFNPVDISGGAVTGKRVYVGDCTGAALVIVKSVEAGTDDPVITFQEHKVSSSGTPITHNIDHYYYKAHATAPETTAWVKVSGVATGAVTFTGLAALAGIIVVPINMTSLSDTYKYLSANVADAGSTAQLATAIWELNDLNVQRAPANLAKTLR